MGVPSFPRSPSGAQSGVWASGLHGVELVKDGLWGRGPVWILSLHSVLSTTTTTLISNPSKDKS